MGEIWSAIAEAIRNRATSTTLVTYSFFWLAWHWQGVFTALFVSEEKILEKHYLLKNEYVNQYFFGWQGWDTVIGLAVPLGLTIFFLWPLQKFVLIYAYKIEQQNKVARKKVKLEQEREVENYKTLLLNKESKTINAQAKKVAAEAKLSTTKKKAAKTDPTIVWDEDYREFKTSRFFRDFRRIRDAVYEHNGYYNFNNGDGTRFELSSDLMAFVDTEGLVKINPDGRRIYLSEKGKYFVKRYQQDTSA
jgi:hypothetical protein